MDLIDASNIPTPITVDPLTSNTIVSNPAPEVSSNAPMIDPDVDMDAASAPATSLTVQSCTVFPFEALNYDQKGRIIRLLSDIAHAWDISSPASAFPYRYHPDPDTHNWGHALLTSMSRLAQLTQAGKSLQAQAVQHAIDHLQDRNDGLSTIEGDYVLRVEDVGHAIFKMRLATTDSYRPHRRGGRGERGSRGRGGRGRGQQQ